MNFILFFLFPGLIAITINDFISSKLIKDEKQSVIFLGCRMLAIVILGVVAIIFINNKALTQTAISIAFGLNVTFPRFKKKHKL
jgi:hypothetical protein